MLIVRSKGLIRGVCLETQLVVRKGRKNRHCLLAGPSSFSRCCVTWGRKRREGFAKRFHHWGNDATLKGN